MTGGAPGLSQRLAEQPFVLLDGGLASELAQRGHDLSSPLWSAAILLNDPAAITAVHLDYLRAGAEVITTASYQASARGLAAQGYSPQSTAELLRLSVRLARAAAEAFVAESPRARPPLVAASIGPYGASLADGSEYTGDYDCDEAGLVEFHRDRAACLAPLADLLACETIPSAAEARALATVLAEVLPRHPGLQAWVTMTCRDARHASCGTPLPDALRPLLAVPGVVALGVNCVHPQHVPALVRSTAALAGPTRAVVAYPNAGEDWDADARTFRGDPMSPPHFASQARSWVTAGARLVGGCCRTTPAHIAALAALRDSEESEYPRDAWR